MVLFSVTLQQKNKFKIIKYKFNIKNLFLKKFIYLLMRISFSLNT